MKIRLFNSLLFPFYAMVKTFRGEEFDPSVICRIILGSFFGFMLVSCYNICSRIFGAQIYFQNRFFLSETIDWVGVFFIGIIIAFFTTSSNDWEDAYSKNPDYRGSLMTVFLLYAIALISLMITQIPGKN